MRQEGTNTRKEKTSLTVSFLVLVTRVAVLIKFMMPSSEAFCHTYRCFHIFFSLSSYGFFVDLHDYQIVLNKCWLIPKCCVVFIFFPFSSFNFIAGMHPDSLYSSYFWAPTQRRLKDVHTYRSVYCHGNSHWHLQGHFVAPHPQEVHWDLPRTLQAWVARSMVSAN